MEHVLPGLRVPRARKTGTTIAGLVFRVSGMIGLEGWKGSHCGDQAGIKAELLLCRMESFWAQTRGLLTIRLWRTKAVRRSTSSPLKSSQYAPGQSPYPNISCTVAHAPLCACTSLSTSIIPFSLSCGGAGVAADTEMTTRMAASKMELHALSTGREPRVATVTRILRQTLFR